MPKVPKDEKYPAGAIGDAITFANIATSELDDVVSVTKAAAALGKKGGRARAAKLSPVQRSEIARLGGKARWKRKGGS